MPPKHDANLQAEIDHLVSNGSKQVSFEEMASMLKQLGYKISKKDGCYSRNRHMTGPCAGRSYPAFNLYVTEASSGLGASNVDARRDDNYKKMQEIRFNESFFSVAHGVIYKL